MTRLKPVTIVRSQSGSVLVIAIIGIVLLGIMAGAAATMTQQNNEEAIKQSKLKTLIAFTQNLEAILANDDACVDLAGAMGGLRFDNGSGYTINGFNYTSALLATGQNVSLGTQLPVGAGRFIAAAGASYAPSNIFINRLFIRNATQVPLTTTYNAELVLQASVNGRGFAPREVGTVTITVDGSNNLTSCKFTQSAIAACQSMNCKFNAAAPSQKCVCGFPAMSCQTSPGQPQQYISGINQTTSPPTAICSNFKVDCSDTTAGGKGPGFFLSGFDQDGNPICQPVEGGTIACTGGATTTLSAVPAAPAGCFCSAGQTWDGTNCTAATPVYQSNYHCMTPVAPCTPPYCPASCLIHYAGDCSGYTLGYSCSTANVVSICIQTASVCYPGTATCVQPSVGSTCSPAGAQRGCCVSSGTRSVSTCSSGTWSAAASVSDPSCP